MAIATEGIPVTRSRCTSCTAMRGFGESGGYEHFGITVRDRGALDAAIATVEAAGGALVEKGEHAPGVPYAYVQDPDGYVIEL